MKKTKMIKNKTRATAAVVIILIISTDGKITGALWHRNGGGGSTPPDKLVPLSYRYVGKKTNGPP